MPAPLSLSVPLIGNIANFNGCAFWGLSSSLGIGGNPTTVGTNGGASNYGTYDQTGNLDEITDTAISFNPSIRVMRGGSYADNLNQSSVDRNTTSDSKIEYIGFRIATNTNPLTYSSFVLVGDPNNPQDSTGYGSVSHNYKIQKYELTNDEYSQFLNSVATTTDDYGLYVSDMSNLSMGGILRTGGSGSYLYSSKPNMGNKPVNFVDWFCAARLCNWLHNGGNSASSTETGAYTLNGVVTESASFSRNPGATYYVPNENEWYKAAYYDPNKNITGGYWNYATQNDTLPNCVCANIFGDGMVCKIPSGCNSANYNNIADWDGQDGNVTTVGTNGGPSAYGTYDQSGNILQWNDLDDTPGSSRGLRGGSCGQSSLALSSSYSELFPTSGGIIDYVGFRLASLLNPFSLSNFVLVGDAGNVADTGGSVGKGSVAYNYYINKYCVTNTEYAQFLNSVAVTDSYDLYNASMSVGRGGITRAGTSGSYYYIVNTNYDNKPVVWANWFKCARYCNWLHNNKPTGAQNNSTTEDGAYTLNGAVSGTAVAKNAGAKYHIPTENEWYKTAYYKSGSTNAGYWTYATQSNSIPVCVTANIVGDGIACSTTTTTRSPVFA